MEEAPKKVIFSISTGTVIRTLLVVAAAFLALYILDIILIILLAILIASAIQPGVKWLQRRRIPRIVATVMIYVIGIALITAFFIFIVPSFLDDLANFMNMLPEKISALSVKTKGIGSDFFSWQSAVQGLSSSDSLGQAAQNITSTLSTASGNILATLTAIFGGVVSTLLIIVLSFYFAVQEGSIEDFLRLITPLRNEEYIIGLWKRTEHKIGKWLQGQMILALIVGVLVYIGLTILGVQNALLLALIAAIFEIIPVFGPFIGSVPGVLIGFVQGGFTFGFIVALMYLIIQQIESNVIYPLVVQKVLNVSPVVVMIALVVGAKLGGLPGIILSVPIAAGAVEYMSDIGEKRTVARARMNNKVLE